jgi:hypothetical protein
MEANGSTSPDFEVTFPLIPWALPSIIEARRKKHKKIGFKSRLLRLMVVVVNGVGKIIFNVLTSQFYCGC